MKRIHYIGRGRRSIRLKEHDYARPGVYFVTICTHDPDSRLSDISEGNAIPSPLGEVVQSTWGELTDSFPTIGLDEFILMPDHVHGIIHIVDNGYVQVAEGAASSAPTLGSVVRAFKSVSAIRCNQLLGRPREPFWQRNYYEHVIRDEEELNRIRQYVRDNPAMWEEEGKE